LFRQQGAAVPAVKAGAHDPFVAVQFGHGGVRGQMGAAAWAGAASRAASIAPAAAVQRVCLILDVMGLSFPCRKSRTGREASFFYCTLSGPSCQKLLRFAAAIVLSAKICYTEVHRTKQAELFC